MSPRAELAARLATFVGEYNLCNPYGGDVRKVEKPRPHYTIGFSRPAVLDGSIAVWGPTFIKIDFIHRGHGDYRLVFASEENAIAFLRAAFVEHDWTKAWGVPQKPEKKQ